MIIITKQDGQPLHFGLCVWSTGVKATPLIEGLGDQVQKGAPSHTCSPNHPTKISFHIQPIT